MIRTLEQSDVDVVVQIHLKSFPGFFLSFLGDQFLRIYYSAVAKAPERIAFVYLDADGHLVGFVVGTSDPRGFYSRLLKRDWLRFAWASMSAVCRKPSIIIRLLRAVTYPSQNPIGDRVAGLFSIGVIPGSQNGGIGKSLIKIFLDEARRRGCESVFLTTDRDNNDLTNHFYQSNGFYLKRQYVTPEGRGMFEYWIDLPLVGNIIMGGGV